jgi:hypothetical protein
VVRNQNVIRQLSGSHVGSCREVTRQLSRSCKSAIRQSSGSQLTVIRQTIGSCQAVIRQSSRSHQVDISLLFFTHSSFQRLTLTPRTLLPAWLSYCVHGKFSEYGFGLKHHFQSYCLMLGNSIRYSTRSLKKMFFFNIKIFLLTILFNNMTGSSKVSKSDF